MTGSCAPSLDDAGWRVPAHEIALYGAKAHKYALVIPVINEGDRIRGQLSRIKEAKLAVDVIVADGGSTDGSLDAGFVGPIGVRAVLTKTGPGKLSAQLRMAYAWCLREGYAGVVTIDGNGKDGVEAVAEMAAKLDEGCDYVQGSRYLPGGEAENTPLERTIANRLIHAPLLSLAGRHLFTDTTNGFRAYSARYLTHPDVRPFRDEFEVYNLLFYLTIRAGQLGLKVDHVAVQRRYPDSGKVPTKIGGLSSKLALLGGTVVAATGGYTPDNTAAKPHGLGWQALVVASILLPFLLGAIVVPAFSPDSWALYELSKTVFADFYRFSHFRSYAGASDYSSAFAPLWPGLIALVDSVFGTGARTGIYLAFISFFGFALVSETIGQRLTGARWIGAAIAMLLLLGAHMVTDELRAGRTIPLQLLLIAVVVHGLLKGRAITAWGATGIGFVAGLAVMNRFDAALLPLLVALFIGGLTRSPVRAGAALVASLIAVSPWMIYSWTNFGTVFATDNSGVATALDARAFVTDWWPEAQPTLRDDPAAFALKVLGNTGQWVWNGLSLLVTPLGAAFALGLALLGGLQFFAAKAPHPRVSEAARVNALWVIAGSATMLAVAMAPQVVTGYLEYRYYNALFWAVLLMIAAWTVSRAITRSQAQVYASLFAGVIAVCVAGNAAFELGNAAHSGRLDGGKWERFEADPDVAQLLSCLADDKRARVLVVGDDAFAAKAGAVASLRTMLEPRNMAQGRLDQAGREAFLAKWEVDYVLVRDKARADDLRDLVAVTRKTDCDAPLFAIAI